eukprot:scaffold126259_cov21-Phaeocystis_antarctica.AAC.1
MGAPPGFPSAMTGSRHWTARRGSRGGVSPAADTPRQHARPRVEAIGRSLVAIGGWSRAPARICGRGGAHGRVRRRSREPP